MIRLLPLFALLPHAAHADWAPRPAMFDYSSAFAVCTAQPDARDLATACADTLEAAYILKRAVAQAAFVCADTPLSGCPVPLEDEGLPAIAARIAGDIGCDSTPIETLPTDTALPRDHCVALTADIMFDEGVVPLFTDLSCDGLPSECDDLADIHAALWVQAVDALTHDDPTITDLQARNLNTCTTQDDARACIAARAAELWVDLVGQDPL
ncbi:hypothetical protein [Pseudooctadecabacter jejudonensis]|uniref:Secreted protein n=1 Tax=Pseudooctadecabacter jejudonensis TaxID=1391910 RepID=A0A1Y5SP93_9RHOB|nr:hypothetical protein [Pseudooctadecabacter jejudonensis]SLN44867.1 hypothetical protein PSJ8397_02336 [Pseudooctadecabacter jejudonensis]